jgi:hypothetical protein
MRRFWIGGGGALLPLLVTLLALDLVSIIDNYDKYSIGTYVGTALRYAVLFVLGGIVAALNYDEKKPIRLVQLGIAAPALVASYVNAQTPPSPPHRDTAVPAVVRVGDFAFVSSAHAAGIADGSQRPIVVAEFLSDVLRAATRPLPAQKEPAKPEVVVDGAKLQRAIENVMKSTERATAAAEKAAADTAAAARETAPEALDTARKSTAEAANAAQKAESNTKALEETAKALTRPPG